MTDPDRAPYRLPPPSFISWKPVLAILDAIAFPAILFWWTTQWPPHGASMAAVAQAILVYWSLHRAWKAWRNVDDRKWWIVRKLKWYGFMVLLAIFVINSAP